MDKVLLSAADIEAMPEEARQHQFNENAVRHTRSLGDATGLDTIGLHLVRVETGYDSTQYHFHHHDEEFLYILSGRGIAEIGEEQHEVGPGDFMGFTRNSLPHNLHNPFNEDLVYLMGGNRNDFDICDYPKIARRMYRSHGNKQYVELDQVKDVE